MASLRTTTHGGVGNPSGTHVHEYFLRSEGIQASLLAWTRWLGCWRVCCADCQVDPTTGAYIKLVGHSAVVCSPLHCSWPCSLQVIVALVLDLRRSAATADQVPSTNTPLSGLVANACKHHKFTPQRGRDLGIAQTHHDLDSFHHKHVNESSTSFPILKVNGPGLTRTWPGLGLLEKGTPGVRSRWGRAAPQHL